MSIGREDYQERKEARIDRFEQRAASARAESSAAFKAADAIMQHIPPGQPIIVGHHSERHHRRDLDKIDRNMRKSVEAQGKAAYYSSRADSAASNTAISSDDPDALKKLEDKLTALQAAQEQMKAVNAYYRKHKTLDGCPGLSEAERRSIESQWARGWYNGIPFPPYSLSNNNAEINRIKGRIKALQMVDQMEHVEIDFDGGQIVTNEDVNRVQILFDEKPNDATRSKLKSYGFRWSPKEGAWQAPRTPAYLYRAKRILNITDTKPATASEDAEQEDAPPAPAPEEQPAPTAPEVTAWEEATATEDAAGIDGFPQYSIPGA